MDGLLEQVLTGLAKELDTELSGSSCAEPSYLLSSSSAERERGGLQLHSFLKTEESSQILQVCPLPLTLKLSDFNDALSNANPQGDIIAAQKFQQLVDPAPVLSHKYMTSPSSIEDVYGAIVQGASASSDSTYLTSIISDAKFEFDTAAQADFVSNGEWRIVEATPYDWYTDNPERYKSIKIDLNEKNEGKSLLGLVAGKSSPTTLALGDKKMALSKATNLTHCNLEYMLVRFTRPWMDFTLFKTHGWWLTGQSSGYCSSGRRDINSGVLPLITTGMIIARSVEFEGDWDPEDQKKINDIRDTNEDAYIGPYRLSKKSDSVSTVNVVAWISELVPFSPQIAGASASTILNFRNEGSFKAICVVKWVLNGNHQRTRCVLITGNADKIVVPPKATGVVVIIRAKNRKKKRLLFRKKYAALSMKNYVIAGTFKNLQINEA